MLITLLVLCFFNHVAFAADITYFTVIPNTRSEDKTNLTNTIFEVTVDDCKVACQAAQNCSVFNYNKGDIYCHLHSYLGETKESDYYDRYIQHTVDENSPINGEWAPWGNYVLVSGSNCSDIIEKRTRTCSNPSPANSGLECVGPGEETLVSDCLVTEYTLINNTRAENKDFLVGTSEVDGDLEKCKAACTAEPSCVIFTYNRPSEYCYLHSVNGESKFSSTYEKYVKFVYDSSKQVDGAWGAWGDWKYVSGTNCANTINSRERSCDVPAPSNGGADCPGEVVEEITTTCYQGLPTLASYPDVFTEYPGIKSTSLGAKVHVQLNGVDIDLCKRNALLRHSRLSYGIDYQISTKKCYIQYYDHFTNGNTTSDDDFIHLTIENMPSPNVLPMPGPFAEVETTYPSYTSSVAPIFNETSIDLENCKGLCLTTDNCMYIGFSQDKLECLIYNGDISESLIEDATNSNSIFKIDRAFKKYPFAAPRDYEAEDDLIEIFSDATVEQCKRLCLYNNQCKSLRYDHIHASSSCSIYKKDFDPALELFSAFTDEVEGGHYTNSTFYSLNDFGSTTDFKSFFKENKGLRSVPHYTNVIKELSEFVIGCQRSCLGINECVAFDFVSFTDDDNSPGRCFLQNATTAVELLSTAEPDFIYYEVIEEMAVRVNLTQQSDSIQCPMGQTCVGNYEKFASSRSFDRYGRIIKEFGSVKEPVSVEFCLDTCTNTIECVAVDYNFEEGKCDLQSYSAPVDSNDGHDHYKLRSRTVEQEPEESNTLLIIIISCSLAGLVLVVLGALLGIYIYKKKQEDLLDGMSPKEFVLQHDGNQNIDLISDEEYSKTKDLEKQQTPALTRNTSTTNSLTANTEYVETADLQGKTSEDSDNDYNNVYRAPSQTMITPGSSTGQLLYGEKEKDLDNESSTYLAVTPRSTFEKKFDVNPSPLSNPAVLANRFLRESEEYEYVSQEEAQVGSNNINKDEEPEEYSPVDNGDKEMQIDATGEYGAVDSGVNVETDEYLSIDGC